MGAVNIESNKPSSSSDYSGGDGEDEGFFDDEDDDTFSRGIGGASEGSVSPRDKASGWNTKPAAVRLPREALPKHVALIMVGGWLVAFTQPSVELHVLCATPAPA